MSPKPTTTAFLGLSHLGIVTSIGWASLGQPTLGLDPDHATAARLQNGDLQVEEPGLPDLLSRSQDWISFTSDLRELAGCSLVVVSRDVPTDAHNVSNLEPVRQLIDAALPHLGQDVTLVVMSQVPPGFTRRLAEQVRAARPDLRFVLLYWVETLIFGDAVQRTLKPERFIVGTATLGAALPAPFAEGLSRYGCPILTMGYESAELTKTAINLYLIGSVTYTNTLADLCEALGADWSEIAPALRLDRRIGPAAYLRPSLGVAGGNLERDLNTLRELSTAHALDTTYLDALGEVNARRFNWVRQHLQHRVFGRVARPTIAIWGLTYKKNTLSTKNSPALRLIADLLSQGQAAIRAWDPVIHPDTLALEVGGADARDGVLDGADCLVIMSDWDHFASADLEVVRRALKSPVVIDSVGVLGHRRSEMDGIEYVGMGLGLRPRSP